MPSLLRCRNENILNKFNKFVDVKCKRRYYAELSKYVLQRGLYSSPEDSSSVFDVRLPSIPFLFHSYYKPPKYSMNFYRQYYRMNNFILHGEFCVGSSITRPSSNRHFSICSFFDLLLYYS